jgi:antibiotic biosynthesis monooxygenase (ABM) superfamily enzyme
VDEIIPSAWRRQAREITMGMFINIAAEDVEAFDAWRKSNDGSGEKVIVVEPLSRKRTDSFKVWFDTPLAAQAKARWYKPSYNVVVNAVAAE